MAYTAYGTKDYYNEQIRNAKAIIEVLEAGIHAFSRAAIGSPAQKDNRAVFEATFAEIDSKNLIIEEYENKLHEMEELEKEHAKEDTEA